MIIEQTIFTIFSIVLCCFMVFKRLKEKDSNYTTIIVIQAVGFMINFIEMVFKVKMNFIFSLMKYTFSIIIPVFVFVIERKGIPLIQVLNVWKAKFYIKIKDNKKAKNQLIDLVTKYPENYIGHKMLAELYKKEGGMRKSIDEYVQAIDINKKDYDSYYTVAELLNNLGKVDEASQMLFSLLSKKPDYYKATDLLGNILLDKQMYKEAVNVYQDALRFHPMNYDFNYNLGIAYTMLNNFQDAKICYQKAAEINSLLYKANYSIGEIALLCRELEEAEKYFRNAIEDEELAANSYYELSKISLIKGDKDNAIKYANIALDINAFEIAPKVKNDPIFIPILAKISIPFNIEEPEFSKNKLTQVDKMAIEHLQEMFDITVNLKDNDVKVSNRENKSYEFDHSKGREF